MIFCDWKWLAIFVLQCHVQKLPDGEYIYRRKILLYFVLHFIFNATFSVLKICWWTLFYICNYNVPTCEYVVNVLFCKLQYFSIIMFDFRGWHAGDCVCVSASNTGYTLFGFISNDPFARTNIGCNVLYEINAFHPTNPTFCMKMPLSKLKLFYGTYLYFSLIIVFRYLSLPFQHVSLKRYFTKFMSIEPAKLHCWITVISV